jgi:WD40 repeat protein
MASLVGRTGGIGAVAFSHNGRILATRSGDRSIELRDLSDLRDLGDRPLLHPRAILTGHTASVNGVAFSPYDDMLASAGSDNTVRLWDLNDDGHAIGQPLIGVGDRVMRVAFSPDGHTLVASGDGPTVQLWALPDQTSPEQLQRSICDRAGRNLSTEEWKRYISSIPFRDVCSP